MKKFEQMAINEICEEIWNNAMDAYRIFGVNAWTRLDYCTAWTTENQDYEYLMSYNTIIATHDKKRDITVDMLRNVYGYTATSAKHISKFRHGVKITWRAV